MNQQKQNSTEAQELQKNIKFNDNNFENSSINVINEGTFGLAGQRFVNDREEEYFSALLGFGLSQALLSGVIGPNDSAMGMTGDGVLFLSTLNNKSIIIGGSPNREIGLTDFFLKIRPELKSLEWQGNKRIRPVITDGVQSMIFESNIGASEGEITFCFFATDSNNNSIAQKCFQIGKNNSASVQGMNSQIVAPKDFVTMPDNVKAQFDNNTGDPVIEEWFSNITSCLIYEEYLQGIGLLPEGLQNFCDSIGRKVPQSILGDVEAVRTITGHEGGLFFESLNYISRENVDFNVIGADAHIRREQIVTGNFTNSSQTICDFDDLTLCNFESESVAPEIGRDWDAVTEPECHSDSCANVKGGNFKVMCEDRNYSNLENINISFWLTTSFGAGGDNVLITLNDNQGNESNFFIELSTVSDTFNSFVFNSTFENKPNVTMCFDFDGQNVNREVWVDEIMLTADLITPAIINQTEEQGAIWLGEDGDDPDRCGINVFFETNATTQDVQKVLEVGCPTGLTRIIGSVEQTDITIINQNITGNQIVNGNSTVMGTFITDNIRNRTEAGITIGENVNFLGNLNGSMANLTNWFWGFFSFLNVTGDVEASSFTLNDTTISDWDDVDTNISINFGANESDLLGPSIPFLLTDKGVLKMDVTSTGDALWQQVGNEIRNTNGNTLNFTGNIIASGNITLQQNLTTSDGGKLWSNATCTFLSSPDGSTTLEICNA